MTTTAIKPMKNKNPSSAFGADQGGAPRIISEERNSTTVINIAAITNITPMSDRSRRVAPRTISAPQPRQILASSDTAVWQCGHTSAFIAEL